MKNCSCPHRRIVLRLHARNFIAAVERYRNALVVKPVAGSSGHGPGTVRHADKIEGWRMERLQEGGRAEQADVIVEGFVDFDYEIALLTVLEAVRVRHSLQPVGRIQKADYRYSWQRVMTGTALQPARAITLK